MMKLIFGVCWLIIALSLNACAPTGYIYEGFTLVAEDVCARPKTSSVLISYLNAEVGQPNGPPSRVLSIQGLKSSAPFQPWGGASTSCHGTLALASGANESGIIQADRASCTPSCDNQPLYVYWKSDTDIAKQIEMKNSKAEARNRRINEYAFTVPLEKGAIFHEMEPERADMLVRSVKNAGFICDSIAAVMPNAYGDKVMCNKARYQYIVGEKNGAIFVIPQ